MQEIFLAAVEHHRPEDRDAYLNQACGTDDELRRQVNLLLKAHHQAGSVPGAAPSEQGGTRDFETPAECPGTPIGPYKLLQQIGEGGMGTVFMAEQTEPVRRMVALKIIKPGMESSQVIARFEAERQALALMDHPNIAKVFDAGTTLDGRPYFVMELVKGVPITRYCDENQLTPRERLDLCVPVCQAVQHAHQKGVIHRDLKPTNVLIALYDDRPVPKVIDFGVAKAAGEKLTERTMFTTFGSFVGTLEYMSPEQAKLNALDIDTRSDVYALGVLLYELLTGSTPLQRARLKDAALDELLRLVREEEPPKPSTRLSQSGEALEAISRRRRTEPTKLGQVLRGELDWIVMKCLEKDRTRRYETASGLALDIQRYLADEPVEACPPSKRYRFGKFWRRHKRPVIAAATILLALVGGMLGTTWGLVLADKARQNEKEQRQIAQRKEEEALDAQRLEVQARRQIEQDRDEKAKALVRAESLRLTAQSSAELHSDPGLAMLLAIEAAQRMPGLEKNNALFAALEACREERTLFGHTGRVLAAQFTPDGKRILSCAKDGTVRCWDVLGGKQLFQTPRIGYGEEMAGMVLSPDGKFFVTLYIGTIRLSFPDIERLVYTDRVVRLWDATTGKQLAVLRGHKARVVAASFTTDGRRIVTTSLDTTVRVWDIPSGKERVVIRGHALAPFSCRFSADARQVLTVSSGHQITAIKPEDSVGEVDPEEIRSPGQNHSYAYLSGGDSWSMIDPREQILAGVWDAESGKEMATIRKPKELLGRDSEVPAFGEFSSDGQRVILGFSEDAQVWDVATGKVLHRLPHSGMSGENHAAWSLDAKRLATIRGAKVSIWEAKSAQELATLRGHEETVRSVSFSPDSKLVLTTSSDRTARVWDAASGEAVAVLKGHSSPVNTAVLSSDGRRIVTAGEDHTVRLWRLNPPNEYALPLAGPMVDPKNVMALSPDGRRLATGGHDFLNPGSCIWDTATGKLLHKLKAPRDKLPAKLADRDIFGEVWGVTFSSDGRRLLTVGRERKIHITGRTVSSRSFRDSEFGSFQR
jgi:WD40 repeat protein/serine/threonine protein kinase